MPRIWKEDERSGVVELLRAAVSLQVDGVMAGDPGGVAMSIQSGLQTVTDFSIPVFNDLAIQHLLRQGVTRMTLSPELNREQLQNIRFRGASCLELVVHGSLPMMVSEHCTAGAVIQGSELPQQVPGRGDRCSGLCRETPCFLNDRQGYRFPLQFDEHCRITLYNARELCLIGHLDDIIQVGYASLRLDLRSHEAQDVREITRIYRHALEKMLGNNWNSVTARQAWEQLEPLSVQGLTRGHYLRGVLEQTAARG
jgi:putative protease